MRVNALPPTGLSARLLACVALVWVAWGGAAAAPAPQAAASAAGAIYTCIDDKGRRLTADRPIPECATREQRVLNRDGSLKATHPPTQTAEERAEAEARERKAAEARAAQLESTRRDRNLMQRYKDEESHRRAREASLDTVRAAMRITDVRLADLARERKPLQDEAEFYKGRALPPKLRQQLDANDAAVEAQRVAALNQQAELERITALYDAELERLKRLWAGAAPGSLGPLPVRPSTASATATATTTAAPPPKP
jgi:chromosome segregation ATPase